VSVINIEKLVADYLRAQSAITSSGARMVAKTPDSLVAPWVRITQLDAPNATGAEVEHLIGYMVQLDCYAGEEGGQPEAVNVALAVRRALIALPGTRDGVVVTGTRIVGHIRRPDIDREPARERVILTAEIHAH
jgi:hypothetical protein